MACCCVGVRKRSQEIGTLFACGRLKRRLECIVVAVVGDDCWAFTTVTNVGVGVIHNFHLLDKVTCLQVLGRGEACSREPSHRLNRHHNPSCLCPHRPYYKGSAEKSESIFVLVAVDKILQSGARTRHPALGIANKTRSLPVVPRCNPMGSTRTTKVMMATTLTTKRTKNLYEKMTINLIHNQCHSEA